MTDMLTYIGNFLIATRYDILKLLVISTIITTILIVILYLVIVNSYSKLLNEISHLRTTILEIKEDEDVKQLET